MAGGGANALDFLIAFHVGHISLRDPQAHFHILSGDGGFLPLVHHLKDMGISATCSKEFELKMEKTPQWDSYSGEEFFQEFLWKDGESRLKLAEETQIVPATKSSKKVKKIAAPSTGPTPSVPKKRKGVNDGETEEARKTRVIKNLKRVKSRPTNLIRLKNQLNTWCNNSLGVKKVNALVHSLEEAGVICVNGEKVSYEF